MTFPKPFSQTVSLGDLEGRLRDAALPSSLKVSPPYRTSDDNLPEPAGEDASNGGMGSGADKAEAVAAVQSNSASSRPSIDLDDLGGQLRGADSHWPFRHTSASEANHDALAQLTMIVGSRQRALRHLWRWRSGRADAPEQPRSLQGSVADLQSGDSDQGQADLETSMAGSRMTGLPQDGRGEPQLIKTDEQEAKLARLANSEIWDFRPSGRGGDATATAPSGNGVRAQDIPHAGSGPHATPARSVVSRTARSLALPLLFVTTAFGAVAVISVGPDGEGPAISASDPSIESQPSVPAGNNQIPSPLPIGTVGSSGEPAQPVAQADQPPKIAAPTIGSPGKGETPRAPASPEVAAVPRALPAANTPVNDGDDVSARAGLPGLSANGEMASRSGIGVVDVSGLPSQSIVLAERPADAVTAPTPVPRGEAGSATVGTGVAAGPAPVNLPTARSRGTMAPKPAAATALKRDVASVPANPNGIIGENAKPKSPSLPPGKSLTRTVAATASSAGGPFVASPTLGRPVSTTRAKPSAVPSGAHSRTVMTMSPLPRPKFDLDRNNPPGNDGDSGAPLSITPQALPDSIVDALQTPTPSDQPAAIEPRARANAAGHSSSWIGLGSSPSESEARATLLQLEKQFPGALSSGSIRPEDRGSEGVFYRIRVGPLSLEAAAKICSRLRAAGKSCLLIRG